MKPEFKFQFFLLSGDLVRQSASGSPLAYLDLDFKPNQSHVMPDVDFLGSSNMREHLLALNTPCFLLGTLHLPGSTLS